MVEVARERLGQLGQVGDEAVEVGAVERGGDPGQRGPRRRLGHPAGSGAVDVTDEHAFAQSGVTAVTSPLMLIRIGA